MVDFYPTTLKIEFLDTNERHCNEDDSRIKCGEIFRDRAGLFWLKCDQCDLHQFTVLDDYISHINDHFSRLNFTRKEGDKAKNDDNLIESNLKTELNLDYDDSVSLPEQPIFVRNINMDNENLRKAKEMSLVNKVTLDIARIETIDKKKHAPKKKLPKSSKKHNKLNKETMNVVKNKMLMNQSRHIMYRTLPDVAKCDICNANVIGNRNGMLDHMWLQHSYGSVCPHCGRNFRLDENMWRHLETHFGAARPFQCKICGIYLQTKPYLRVHILRHKNIRPYLCTFCGKTFFSTSQLHQHHRDFHPVDPTVRYPCDFCGRDFDRKSRLRVHVKRVHETVPDAVQCDICHATMKSRKVMLQHMQLHSGSKSYACRYCESRFAQAAGRRCHERRAHEVSLVS